MLDRKWITGERGGEFFWHLSHMKRYMPVKVYRSTIEARKRRRKEKKMAEENKRRRKEGEGICFTCKFCDGFTLAGWSREPNLAAKCVNARMIDRWYANDVENIEEGYEAFEQQGFSPIPRIEMTMPDDYVCEEWVSRFSS